MLGTTSLCLCKSGIITPTRVHHNIGDIIIEFQRYGSTYHPIRKGLLSTTQVVSWLKTQPVTINNLITYRHCLMIDKNTPMIDINEYRYIYQLSNKVHVKINDCLKRLYLLITDMVDNVTKSEMGIWIKSNLNPNRFKVDPSLLLSHDIIIRRHTKKDIEQRKQKLMNTRYYWNVVKDIYNV
jgi:hypothetical protein